MKLYNKYVKVWLMTNANLIAWNAHADAYIFRLFV